VRTISESVCADDVGRECVRERLKRIDLTQFHDPTDQRLNWFDGVWSVSGDWAAATPGGWPKRDKTQSVLGKGL